MDKKPIEFRQLCALMKMVLQQQPSIDDAEWKALAKDTMAKWGFSEPDAAMLARAMTGVEQALKQTIGPRPTRTVPLPSSPAPTPSQPVSSARTHRPAGWDIVVALMARLKASTASVRSLAPAPDGPRETLDISEPAALDEFWRVCRDGRTDRVATLRAFAEIAIVRPAGWNPAEIRATTDDSLLSADHCFGCGAGVRLSWHHIIQIQHGGSNYVRNRVAICDACHAQVHPWLPAHPRVTSGWAQLGEIRLPDQGDKDVRRRQGTVRDTA